MTEHIFQFVNAWESSDKYVQVLPNQYQAQLVNKSPLLPWEREVCELKKNLTGATGATENASLGGIWAYVSLTTSSVRIIVWLNNTSSGQISCIGLNLNVQDNCILIVVDKMYSLIWYNWVLVELFIESNQNLRFPGHDWSFFSIHERTREKFQKDTSVT